MFESFPEFNGYIFVEFLMRKDLLSANAVFTSPLGPVYEIGTSSVSNGTCIEVFIRWKHLVKLNLFDWLLNSQVFDSQIQILYYMVPDD